MFFNTDDMSIYYEKHGNSDKTIVILPGWGNTRATFRNIINYFKNDYTIYIFDYPGFGNSPIPSKTLDIYDYARIIRDFFEEEKIVDPIIIAHSFGGRITALLAGYYKIRFKKILFMDIAGIKPKKTLKQIFRQSLYKILKKLTKILPKIKQEYYRQKLLTHFGSSDYNSLPPIMRNTFKNIVNEDLKIYFKNIDDEVLILWGKKDNVTPLKDAYKLRNLIKDSALIVLPECSHFVYLDAIVVTNKIIYEYLKEKS